MTTNSDMTKAKRKALAQQLEQEFFTEVKPLERLHAHEMHYLIAKEIDAVRERKGMSKKDMAEAIGIDPGLLTRWLGGRQNLTINSIAKMHVALGEPVVMIGKNAYKTWQERGLKGTPFGWTESESDDDLMVHQASHPGEVALIKFKDAKTVGFQHATKNATDAPAVTAESETLTA